MLGDSGFTRFTTDGTTCFFIATVFSQGLNVGADVTLHFRVNGCVNLGQEKDPDERQAVLDAKTCNLLPKFALTADDSG